jgi:molybdopterin/thiamine biosynthesis adenylyltransferase
MDFGDRDGVVEDRYARHWDMIDVERLHTLPIRIIGAGSVGSFTCLSLSKMGAHSIKVWDDDMVDEHNISNQFYRTQDVGEFKVDALQNMIMDFEGIPIQIENEKWYGDTDCNGIIIAAVDNMNARKRIWDKIKGNDDVSLFIDPRMGGRVARIYAVNPMNPGDFEDTLYDDDEAAEERCTERTILYNVLGISSYICKMIEDWMKDGVDSCQELVLDYATYTLLTR